MNTRLRCVWRILLWSCILLRHGQSASDASSSESRVVSELGKPSQVGDLFQGCASPHAFGVWVLLARGGSSNV